MRVRFAYDTYLRLRLLRHLLPSVRPTDVCAWLLRQLLRRVPQISV